MIFVTSDGTPTPTNTQVTTIQTQLVNLLQAPGAVMAGY